MINRPRISTEVQPALKQLTGFWPFKRKSLVAALSKHIASFEQQAHALFDSHTALQAQSTQQEQENNQLIQACSTLGEQVQELEADIERRKEHFRQLALRYVQEQSLCRETAAELQTAVEQISALEQTLTREMAERDVCQNSLNQLQEHFDQQAQENTELRQAHELLNQHIQGLEDDLQQQQDQYALLELQQGEEHARCAESAVQLQAATEQVSTLEQALAQAVAEHEACQETLNRFHELFTQHGQENTQLTETCAALNAQIQELEGNLQQQKDQCAQLEVQYAEEQAHCDDLRARLQLSTERVSALEQQLASQTAASETHQGRIEQLSELNEQLNSANDRLLVDHQHIYQEQLSLNERFNLVQRLLALAAPTNQGLLHIAQLIREDYQDFAARAPSLTDKAEALRSLQKIQRELEGISRFPALNGKTMLGVAGAANSGKSAFINSFIQETSLRLATGARPVTQVPGYITCAMESHIRGYSINGGSIELDNTDYQILSQKNVKPFSFDLCRIMSAISLQVPMDLGLFQHLCLVDTPTNQQLAASILEQSKAMIWVLGLDRAEIITATDIDFIKQAGFVGQCLYISLNKADLKSPEEIEAVMLQVTAALASAGIEYAGISAYSAKAKAVYACNGLSLEQFIQSYNTQQEVLPRLNASIDMLFNDYAQAIRKDIKERSAQHKHFEKVKMDSLDANSSAALKRLQAAYLAIEMTFDTTDLQQLLDESKGLCKAFKDSVRQALAQSVSAGRRARI